MKKFLLFTLLLACRYSYATHIVGGEFELIHDHDFLYHVNMIFYFDDVNGNPKAEDTLIDVSIFRKRDNVYMQNVSLIDQGSTFVPYTNIACTLAELRTRRIFYTADITLDSSLYNDPEGYYLVWERCCRNKTITNIIVPDQTGQVFYLEFPPVVQNGRPFIDSSPILFPPLSDYACVNNLYYVDFAGTDPDGDSLAYSIIQPLAGFTSQADPVSIPPVPGPYPVVQWAPGINTGNTIPGNPPLKISQEGLLTVRPSQSGLFVFCVLCEEFRKGVKIGEVRRDFQMLSLDCPDPGHAPQLAVKTPGSISYSSHPDTIHFKQNEKKCLNFFVQDQDGQSKIKLRIKPVNFIADIRDLLPVDSAYLAGPNDSIKFDVCFPDCPYRRDVPYRIDLIAGDNACPLPLLDTLHLIIEVEPPPNHLPYFTDTSGIISKNVNAGDTVNIPLTGKDDDNDSLVYSVIPVGFDTAKYSMNFTTLINKPGLLSLDYRWNTDCKKNDFNTNRKFLMLVTLEDEDYCKVPDADTMQLLIQVTLPPNQLPVVTSDLPADSVSVEILNRLDFHVHANDPDGDSLTFHSEPLGFREKDFGFSSIHILGGGDITAPYSWNLLCKYFNSVPVEPFKINFIAEDHDQCKISSGDTLQILFYALAPANHAPVISFDNFTEPADSMVPGDQLVLDITGADQDQDSVFLSLKDASDFKKNYNLDFSPVKGKGVVKSELQWNVDCSFLSKGDGSRGINLEFILKDDHCLVASADSSPFAIDLRDRESDFKNVIPPNVFTPNHTDDKNEYFLIKNLPEDNCINHFEYVSVYNRYGKEVFYSTDRNFKWSGDNVDPGVYFYLVKYSAMDIKGYVQVLY